MTEIAFYVFIASGWVCLTFLTIYVAKGGLRCKIKVGNATEEKILSKLHNLIYNDQKDPDGWDVLRVKNYSEVNIRTYMTSFCVHLTNDLYFWIRRDRCEKCVEIEFIGSISYKTKQVAFKTTDKRAHQIVDELLVRDHILKEWSDK